MDGRGEAEDVGGQRPRVQPWGDARSRELIQAVAEEIPARAGVQSCTVEVVQPDGRLEVVAQVGHPGAGSWLAVPVLDDGDETRAVVRLGPVDGPGPQTEEPDQDRVDAISEALRLPLHCLLTIVEHESFAHHVRMASVVRRLLHTEEARFDEDALVGRPVDELGNAFEATAFEIHVFGEDWTGPLSQRLAPSDCSALAEAAQRACAAGEVVVFEPGHVWGDEELRGIEPALSSMIADAAASTVVLAPVGAARTPLGLMLIARGWEGRPWTEVESEAALDFGHDLGRKILNARTTCRERELLDQLNWHEELRRSFLSTITHELKTPLTIIRANAELLAMEDEVPPRVTHRLRRSSGASPGCWAWSTASPPWPRSATRT